MYAEQWVTADRRKIHVYEMTDTHLINSINRIRRMNGWRQRWLPRLEAELANRRR